MQILVAVGALAGVLAAYWFFALAPKRDEIATLDSRIAAKQAETQQAEATFARYEAARHAYARNYATVVRLGKAVPADDDVRSLLIQLNASAKRAKIDFSSIELQSVGSTSSTSAQAATTDGFTTLPFSFSFEGRYFRLADFFAQLDRYVQVRGDAIGVTGRLLHIDTFTLKPKDDAAAQLQADVHATSYELPSSQSVTAGATAQAPAATATPTPSSGGGSSTTTASAGVTG